MPSVHLSTGDELIVTTDTGRTVHVWVHDCPNCTSVDVWTDRGREVEEFSANTGDPTRAPTGLFAMGGGQRCVLRNGPAPTPETMERYAVSTAILVWNDKEE